MGQTLSGPRTVKALRQVSSQALRNTSLRQSTPASRQLAQMDKMLHLQIQTAENNRRPIFKNRLEQVKVQMRYNDALLHLKTLKAELNPILYYQAHSTERREFHPEETRQWIERIQQVRYEFDRLQAESVPTDTSLQNAYQYLQYALQTIAPAAVVPPLPDVSFQVANRVYNENEFFLRSPEIKPNRAQQMLKHMGISTERITSLPASIRNLSLFKQARQSTTDIPPLPDHLKVLIFNDVEDFTDKLRSLHTSGKFLPTAQLTFVNDIQDVTNQVLRLGNIPDVIFADLTTQKGVEGTLLAQKLRRAGYKGIIIACSGYATNFVDGEVLLQSGIDGFFSRQGNAENIPAALQNFYYYQNLHQWQR